MNDQEEKELRIDGCRFCCRVGTNDADVVRSIFEGEYAVPDLTQYEPGATSLDVGAHIGAYSVWACATYSLLNVLAIEPLPENLQQWTKNREANALQLKMKALQRAAGKETKELIEIVYPDPKLHAESEMHRFIGNSGGNTSPESKVLKVPVVTMGSLLEVVRKVFGAGKLWTVKIDCEGSEVPFLEEAKTEELKLCKWIVGEHHGTIDKVRAVMKRARFVERALRPNQNTDLFCFENPKEFSRL